MTERRGSEYQPPFVGPATFLRSPYADTAAELAALKPDVAILGAPVDIGTVNRPGARLAPRAIRQAGYFGTPNTALYHMGLQVYPTQVLNVVDFGDANCPPTRSRWPTARCGARSRRLSRRERCRSCWAATTPSHSPARQRWRSTGGSVESGSFTSTRIRTPGPSATAERCTATARRCAGS